MRRGRAGCSNRGTLRLVRSPASYPLAVMAGRMAMVARAELQVSAGQLVALLARLGPTASTAMVEQLAMVVPAVQVLQVLMARPCLQMVALAG